MNAYPNHFFFSVAAKLSHEIRLLTSVRFRDRKSANGGPTQGCYQKSAGKQNCDIKRDRISYVAKDK